MAETVAPPVVQMAAEKGIQAIVHQIGYCIHYKKNVKSLAEKVKALHALRTDIQERVTAAKKNLHSIKKNVEIWLENVKKEVEEDQTMAGLMNFINNGEEARMFNHDQCCKGWCCLLTRHKIGRQAKKKIFVIEVLLNDGNSFDDVSYPSPNLVAQAITQFVNIDDNVDFPSREVIMQDIMSALRDEETYSVGIYGMGGVGKTMLKNRVHKQVVEEGIFDIVAMTTVSQNVNVKKIQDDIAQTLGFGELNEIDDTGKRAALLFWRLEAEKRKILIVLDDLWKKDLNLITDVGIPCRSKFCKILITTRIHDALLKIQKIVKVEVLSEDESWHLFKQNAGDMVDSPELHPIAREVVKECACLPLALVTVGRALQGKNKDFWKYTVKQLKKSNFTDIEGMTSKVYSSIKLSYNFLGNDILKRCFLLYCLFPEDESIGVEDLLVYAIGDEVIRGDLEMLMEVRDRLHNAYTKLVALGLLIRGKEFHDKTFSAKMHDVVRDVAISIASGDGNGFFVKAGQSLQRWPEEGLSSISKCSRLSLTGNNITELPGQPELSHLLSLSLRDNFSLGKIPDNFFVKMSTLKSLDISRTSISTLPSSISSLVNLRSLDMGSCVVFGHLSGQDISALGELKNLEILIMSGLNLSFSLPKDIGGLPRLKWLDLSTNRGLTVPPGIISRLTCLEYLNMLDSFQRWEIGDNSGGSCRYANLDEIASLACLDHVRLLAELENDPHFYMNPKDNLWSGSLCCRLSRTFPNCNSIGNIMAKAEKVELNNFSNLKSITSLVTSSRISGLNNAKELEVCRCEEMECVLDSSTLEVIPEALFTALEVMCLWTLPNLKELFRGPMPAEVSLQNLKCVSLSYCPNLVSIFSLEILRKLRNLEELKADNCDELKDVFTFEEGSRVLGSNEIQEHGITCLLPQLRELWLREVPVTSIWKQGIFTLGNLKSVEVIRCHELKYLFTPAIVTALQKLESLMVEDCSSLVTIVASEDQLTAEDYQNMNFQTKTLFLNLRIFKIESCNSLKVFCPPVTDMHCPLEEQEEEEKEAKKEYQRRRNHPIRREKEEELYTGYDCDDKRALILDSVLRMQDIWGGIIPIQSFQNVTEARIEYCGWLKHLIPIKLLLSGGLSQLRKLVIDSCKRLEAIIDTDDHIADPQNHIILENLEILTVRKCNKLRHLLPMKLLAQGGLPKLRTLEVRNCATLKMICYEDRCSDDDDEVSGDNKTVASATFEVFPNLRNLVLICLPKLTSFHRQRNTSIHFGWPSLVSLYIVECNLKRLPLSDKNIPPKLEKIVGDSDEVFDKWLELEDDDSMKSSLRPLFKVYEQGDERGIKKRYMPEQIHEDFNEALEHLQRNLNMILTEP